MYGWTVCSIAIKRGILWQLRTQQGEGEVAGLANGPAEAREQQPRGARDDLTGRHCEHDVVANDPGAREHPEHVVRQQPAEQHRSYAEAAQPDELQQVCGDAARQQVVQAEVCVPTCHVRSREPQAQRQCEQIRRRHLNLKGRRQ